MTKLSWEDYKKANIDAPAAAVSEVRIDEEKKAEWDAASDKKKKDLLKKTDDEAKAQYEEKLAKADVPADVEE
jgi:hypothetical protein